MKLLLFVCAIVAIVLAADVTVKSDFLRAHISENPVLAAKLSAAVDNAILTNNRLNGEEDPFDTQLAARVATLDRIASGSGTSLAARMSAYRQQIIAALGDHRDD